MGPDFDRLAAVYDASRGELEPAVVDALRRELERRGVRRLVEVGVGTGRVAAPLAAAGLYVAGADLSYAMLGRARAKGLDRLVRASGYRLPFRDGRLDAALFVHVLHLLDDPGRVFAEAKRVGRLGCFAVLETGGPGGPVLEPATRDDPRRLLYERLLARGAIRERFRSPRQKEEALLDRFPADELVVLADRTFEEPAERELDRLAQRAYRGLLDVPPAVLDEEVARLREEFGGRPLRRRARPLLAHWRDGNAGVARAIGT
jgi:SAM-dependent methyltransferase